MPAANEPIRNVFGALIARNARQWRRVVDLRLQPFGLTQATWLPLLHLWRATAPMRQTDLARSLALDTSSVVRLVDTLEKEGLVERRPMAGDRRARALHLTAAGEATVGQVEAVAQQVRDQVLEDVDARDLAVTYRVLGDVQRALDALEQERRDD